MALTTDTGAAVVRSLIPARLTGCLSPGITGKISRIDGTPNGQAMSRETAA